MAQTTRWNSQGENLNQPQVFDNTGLPGNKVGYLLSGSKRVAEFTVKRRLFELLLMKCVGTFDLESQALKEERKNNTEKFKGSEGKGKLELIKKFRNPEVVKDLLEVRLKHIREGEDKARTEYGEIKTRIKSWSKSKRSNRTKYSRWVTQVKEVVSRYWEKEIPKVKDKVESLHTKFIKTETEIRRLQAQREKEKWVKAMARGSGPNRVRLKPQVPIYGKVTVDQDELDAAGLPPKFTLFRKPQMDDIKIQGDICDTKIRWNRRGQLVDEEGNVVWDPQDPMSDEQVVLENNQNEIYDPITKKLDFRKLRATLIKNNPRVKMPRARPPLEEAQILTRRTMAHKLATEFIKSQKEYTNLTASEKRGLRKLTKRVKAGEIVVIETDKSGKLAICSMEAYMAMGDAHAMKDKVATWEKVKESQKIILGTLKSLNRIFNTAENEGDDMARAWDAKELQATSIPINSYTPKDHKPVEPDGLPKTRPLCGAHRTMNGELSEYLAKIVESAIMATGKSKESISTEDVLSSVDTAAEQIRSMNLNSEDLFVGSLDASALYPSLDIQKTSRIVGDLVREAGIQWEGVDFRRASIYVAMEMEEYKVIRRNLQHLIPRRRHGFGTKAKKPSVKTTETDDKPESARWKFFRDPSTYTEAEKNLVMGVVVEMLIKTTFSTHYYLWKGQVYKQQGGGPIGLRATGSCAKAVMDKWLACFEDKLAKCGIDLHLITKYVDDVLIVCNNLRLGE